MKLAIDSYCYHRFFGEIYPVIQQDPGRTMTVWEFLRRARRLGVQGVSLESVHLPFEDEEFLTRLREVLDANGFERVWAWGHPNGLCSGTDRDAAKDLVRHIGIARRLGAKVMRIVGGSRRTRPERWAVHKRQLGTMLKNVLGPAEEHGVVLAIENHIDLFADEMAELMTTIDSKWLGVCLDTANNLRMFEDPVTVAKTLIPWTRATHVKDVSVQRGNPREFAFWPSVPLGKGLVDISAIIEMLRKARYTGLLAFEIDYLHPDYRTEFSAVAQSVRYLRKLVEKDGRAPRSVEALHAGSAGPFLSASGSRGATGPRQRFPRRRNS
jgi:sugar phosphate isomerase/epimerase